MHVIHACPACGNPSPAKTCGFLSAFVVHRIWGWPQLFAGTGAQASRLDVRTGVIVCQQCGMVCSDVRLDDDEARRFYEGYMGVGYAAQRAQFEPQFKAIHGFLVDPARLASRFQWAEAFLQEALGDELGHIDRALDFGGDGAGLPRVLREAGRAHAHDFVEGPVSPGARRLADPGAAAPFGLIVCSHVLEHVSDPSRVVAQMRALMAAGSWLYVELPLDLGDRDPARIDPGSYTGLTVHEHINHFSSQAIVRLLQRSGLSVLRVRRDPVSLGWEQTEFLRVLARL